jgi:hypothetical protein
MKRVSISSIELAKVKFLYEENPSIICQNLMHLKEFTHPN